MNEIEQLKDELKQIKSLLFDNIHGVNFMYIQRKLAFQMQGQYDGSMSDDCKLVFKSQYNAWDKLIKEFNKRKV